MASSSSQRVMPIASPLSRSTSRIAPLPPPSRMNGTTPVRKFSMPTSTFSADPESVVTRACMIWLLGGRTGSGRLSHDRPQISNRRSEALTRWLTGSLTGDDDHILDPRYMEVNGDARIGLESGLSQAAGGGRE